MSVFAKRTWAEVDLNKISRNYRKIRDYVSEGSKIMAIVKADAYGNGAPYVAKELEEAGADMFGVSSIDEATQLRQCGITKPLLILGYTPPECAGELMAQHITQTVFNLEYARALSGAAQRAGGRVKIHIKIDTGMSRIGFLFNGKDDQACVGGVSAAVALPGVEAEGVFTHFAVSDEPENDYTRVQFDRFMRALGLLEQKGVKFAIRHCCNSAGLLNDPGMQLDMVRPGIILYGLTPAAGMPMPIELEPVMALKSVAFQVKALDRGTAVSYGMKYVTPDERMVATIPIGYADGYMRSLSNSSDVLVCGRRARIVGRVCMDQCIADVTGIKGVREGSVVTIIGRDGDEAVTMEEIAAKMGTINYETTCLIGKRVPRIFMKDGRQVGLQNYILP